MQRRQSSSGTWPVLGAAVVGVFLFGAVAHLREPAAATVAPAQFHLSGPHPLRCASCGWIEAKRELAPLAAEPRALKVYEYTLRMQDGSLGPRGRSSDGVARKEKDDFGFHVPKGSATRRADGLPGRTGRVVSHRLPLS